MSPLRVAGFVLIAIAVLMAVTGGGSLIGGKVTAVTYFYEKNSGGVPPPVSAALGKLNARDIVATTHEDDATNAGGSIPKQHEKSLPAARAAGLPALVVMAGDSVLRVVSKPTTEAQVLEAAP